MEFPTRRKLVLILVLFGIFFQYFSVSAEETAETKKGSIPAAQSPGETIKSLAVIPFTTKSGLSVKEPGIHLSPEEKYLTISLYEALLREVTGVRILPLQESDTEYARIKSEHPGSYYKNTAIDTGNSLGADSVIVGVISEYRERKGSGYGVESPASVAFSVQLLKTDSGKLLWETYFSETQRALTENVFEIKKFFKRGAKWIAVDELAKEGVRTTAQRLNDYLLEN